ncbi:two-component response regulator-like APRR9 isoform X2 [Salvia miltiorrhiza]|uniref:two-component response regulator-like APRR9 isoform X2 n=1 Tax=Salvia miltiorrhiza TaxID=226208 RepID=UPI0025AD11D9|nr:two-component response regulator-like APRR9 isoform X2 [Salvia miltiorrhiza]
MCSSKTPVSMNKKRRPRARKSRLSKPKKPKFLSLRRQFPPNEMHAPVADSRQLDLFPLHPDNDRESQDQAENVALFFSAADGGATTLTGLLDNSSAVDSNSSHTINTSSRLDYLSASSASLTYAYGEERAALVRTALRSRDRDSGEEKWVRYSEVVERKVKEEEVTSSSVDWWPAAAQRVSLKLDYDEIMNAWSNKGPLFVDAETSQIVPDAEHHFLSHHASTNGVSWDHKNSGLWTVPEIENGEEMKNILGQRKASVLRYKEKRQNRLFSKKIRYQVRKLNAEKRPRLKVNFVIQIQIIKGTFTLHD